jgi:hypothetical protein
MITLNEKVKTQRNNLENPKLAKKGYSFLVSIHR